MGTVTVKGQGRGAALAHALRGSLHVCAFVGRVIGEPCLRVKSGNPSEASSRLTSQPNASRHPSAHTAPTVLAVPFLQPPAKSQPFTSSMKPVGKGKS